MLNSAYFSSKIQVEQLLRNRVIAIITEYTIYKLDVFPDKVVFNCLQNEYTFEIFFKDLQEELKLRPSDLNESFLDTLVTYCAVVNDQKPKTPYPLCEFESLDKLLDWYLHWKLFSEKERLDYLKSL